MSGGEGRRYGPGSIAGRLVLFAAVLLLVPTAVGVRAEWETDSDRRRAERAAMQAALVHVAVVGDSYTEGSGMGGVEEQANWTTIAATLLWTNKRIPVVLKRYAAGGSGYTVRGTRNINLPELVEKEVADHPDYVIIFGSRNDMRRDGVGERAAAAYAVVREKAPQSRLVVVGPPWTNEHVPDDVVRVRNEVRTAALRAGADFWDPLQDRWFFGADAKFIGSDHVHPTDAGHAYMGAKFADKLGIVLGDRSIVDAVPLA